MGEQRPLALAWSPWHDRLHRRLLQQPKLLLQRQPLLLAVSGGQDSMALLVLLQELQRLHHWPLNIWHGDHGWHPESAVIAAELQSWCQKRDLPIQVDQAPQGSTTSEACASLMEHTHEVCRVLLFAVHQHQHRDCSGCKAV